MIKKARSRQRVQLESLERRELLSVSPQLVGDLNLSPPELELQSDNAWLGDEVFFAADDGSGDVELWKSDGTAEGTVRVKDIRSGKEGSLPRDIMAVNGRILFTAYSDEFGRELWTTDGTENGTVLVNDLAPGASSPQLDSFTHMGGTLYFRRDQELWSTDGTDSGTNVVTNTPVDALIASDEHLYFIADVGSGLIGLWMSDGTTEGTRISIVGNIDVVNEELRRIVESNEGSPSLNNEPESDSSDSWVMASNGEKTLYWSTSEESRGLWGINVGVEAPTLLSNTIFGPSAGIVGTFDSLTVVEVEGKTLIEAVGSGLPRQLWESDGIDTIPIDPALPTRHSPTIVGDHQYFFQIDNLDGRAELLRTDGSYTDTIRLSDTDDILMHPSELTEAGGKYYFWAEGADQRLKLWMFDETESSTDIVKDLQWSPGLTDLDFRQKPHYYYSRSMVHLNGELYFAFQPDPSSDTELWKANDSEEQAELITVIPGAGVSFQAAEDQIFIEVKHGTIDSDTPGLYRTDGTAEGTYALYTEGYNDRTLTIAGNQLFFVGLSDEAGEELWVSDGTADGTQLVKDIVPGRQGCGLANMVAVEDTLYFGATDAEGNSGLWKSDGTADGTVVVFDNEAFPIGSGDGVVYFNGYDPSTGSELWKTDGTREGTVMVADLNPGPDGSRKYRSTGTAAEINGRLYFAGNDGFHGYEVWQIPLESEVHSVPGDADRDGLFDSSDLVQVFQRAEYEDQIDGNSTWEDGDWNGDGDFTTSDLVLAFQSGSYQSAALLNSPQANLSSLFDWTDESDDHKKRPALDHGSVDASFQ